MNDREIQIDVTLTDKVTAIKKDRSRTISISGSMSRVRLYQLVNQCVEDFISEDFTEDAEDNLEVTYTLTEKMIYSITSRINQSISDFREEMVESLREY